MARRVQPLLVLALLSGSVGPAQAASPRVTVAPVADASVAAPHATRVLRIGPASRDRAFARFRVPALDGTVSTARLRLRAHAKRRAGLDVIVLPPSARWGERTLRYRNAPRGGTRAGRVARVPRGTFTIALDVARLHLAAGKKLDLAIVPRRCSRTRCPRPLTVGSREAGARGPRLLLQTAAPPVVPPPTPTDTTPPAVTVTAPAPGSSTDGLPSFAGTGEPSPGASPVTVRLTRTGEAAAAQTLTAPVQADGRWSVRAQLAAPGGYTASASQRDAAGNVATTPGVAFAVIPTIAAAGDIACMPGKPVEDWQCQQQATSDLLVDHGYHAVLALGDNQYDVGTLANYNASYAPTWGRVRDITRPIAGNHEYSATYPPPPTATADGYFDYFNGVGAPDGRAGPRGDGWYSFDLGGWHLIALNSNCGQVRKGTAADGCADGSPQETWLQNDLAAHAGACTLAYWHYPRFSSGNATDSDHTEMTQIWNDLVAADADLALVGHQHGYERFAPKDESGAPSAGGLREMVVGSGGEDFHGFGPPDPGSQVINADTFGVLRLSLRSTGYDWKFVPIAGSVFTDSGSEDCH